MSALICLPSVWRPYTFDCVASMDDKLSPHLMVVDNAGAVNMGVARSWNRARERVLGQRLDWLVLCSAAVRFGAPGGTDLLDALEWSDHGIVEAFDPEQRADLGWHLISFRRDVLERVGAFDEQWFAYMEDVDYGWRCQLAYQDWEGLEYAPRPVSRKLPCDATLASVAHGIQLAHVEVDFNLNEERYAAKWLTRPYDRLAGYGGGPRGDHLRHPYGRQDLDWSYTGPPFPRGWT